MTAVAATRVTGWASVHIRPSHSIDSFLVPYLASFIEREIRGGQVKRAFFIRYGKGEDVHVRLRLLVRHDVRIKDYCQELRTILRSIPSHTTAHTGQSAYEVWHEPYDRSLHYFGESRASVYSELMNEQTSYLALGLLSMACGRAATVPCAVAYILFTLLSKASTSALPCLERSLRLALRIMSGQSPAVDQGNDELAVALANAVLGNLTIFDAAFRSDPSIAKLSRLVKRAYRSVPWVVSHSFHLLCNKVGLSIRVEYSVFLCVQTLLSQGETV